MSEGRRFGKVVALRPQNMVDVVFEDLDYPIRRPSRSLTVLNQNPKPKTPVFVAAVLTPESKRTLYRYWVTQPAAPEPLPILKSSHMTIQFRPSLADMATMPIGQEVQLQVTGWASDKKIQAVSVDPLGVGSANAVPHVTFALADVSVPPKLSNDLFAGAATHSKAAAGPVLTARVGWSDGSNYHFAMPEGVQSNPGPRGGLTRSERDALPDSVFALPGRRFPINDSNHGRIALQYILAGRVSERDVGTVVQAVLKRWGRDPEVRAFYEKHKDRLTPENVASIHGRRYQRNPSNEVAALRKLLTVSYEDAPAYFAAEKFSAKLGGKKQEFEGRWVMPSAEISRVSVRFGDAVADFMVEKFQSGKTDPLTERDREAIFDKVNRAEGSPFASLADFDNQREREMKRFEDFMHAYYAAPHALQVELAKALTLRRPLRRGVIDIRQNPKDEAYDPSKEQLRAQAQSIYETNVRRHLGVHYQTPFTDEKGVRLDSLLSEEERRDLFHGNKKKGIYGAFATAVGFQQKHGYLIPGTLEPTEKGRAWAAARFAPENAQHAAENRQDYERTLGAVRKSGYYRVVASESVDSRGRKVMQYQVQPVPPKEAGVPAYRLTQRAAELDAQKAERFRERAPAAARLRMNPRPRRGYVPEDIEGELQYRKFMDEFQKLTPEEARSVFRHNVMGAGEQQRSAQRTVAAMGYDWQVDAEEPEVVRVRNAVDRNRDFIEAKYEARQADLAPLYPTWADVEADLDALGHIAPDAELYQQRMQYERLKGLKSPLLNVALERWKKYRDFADVETTRGMTEGAKLGGITGSGKNRVSSEEDRRKFIESLTALNDSIEGDPNTPPEFKFKQSLFELVEPYMAVRNFIESSRPESERMGVVAYSDIPLELRGDVVQDRVDQKRFFLPLPFMRKKLEVIPEGAGGEKSERQENALDRSQEQREVKKYLQSMQRGFDKETAFWDVERTLLLYTKKKDKDGKVLVGANGYPYKQYYTYTLAPKQTIEEALKASGFEPFAVPTGKDGNLEVEKPQIQTRYVLYIPRTRRYITRKYHTGRALTPTAAELEGRKAVASPKGLGLHTDQLPEQTSRRRPSSPLYTPRGMVDVQNSTSVYPSMILSKYFFVSGEDGVGGAKKIEQAEESLASLEAKKQANDDMAAAVGTVEDVTVEGVPMAQYFLAATASRAAAARAEAAQKPKKQFLSPDENWVKYFKMTNVFRDIARGPWNPDANEGRGGYEGGVRIPAYDVFYTLSAPLAYVTIQHFNNPGNLPHVTARMEAVANVLKELAPVRAPGSEGKPLSVADAYEAVEPIRVGTIAVLDLDPEMVKALRRGNVQPLPSRQDVLGGLSVSAADFAATPLNQLMTKEAETAAEAARRHAAERKLGIDDRLMATLKIQEQALKSGTRVSEYQGVPVYSMRAPEPAPAAATAPIASDKDIEDLLGNPRPQRRRSPQRFARKF